MAQTENERYDLEVFDAARDLAAAYGQNTSGLRLALLQMGVMSDELLSAVSSAQIHPEYYLDNYRGKMCDEGVIEALKDCLRPLHGF